MSTGSLPAHDGRPQDGPAHEPTATAACSGAARSGTSPSGASRSEELRRRCRDRVLGGGESLVELSRSIHAEPELAFDEHRSAAKVSDLLAAHGFDVRLPVAGMDTAFTASCGTGELVVAVCAEYDALPEIGHACGHNVIAAAAAGAGLALAEVADELGITVRVLGTPAEETGGGKVRMLEHGIFDDVALALMVHPGPEEVCAPRSLAISDLQVRYAGRAAHAAAAPETGINAGDALTVAQVAVGLHRQHLERDQMVHGIVTSGGAAPNIVPAHATAVYNLRAADPDSLQRLENRIRACFEAGATATGCTHETVRISPVYTELVTDEWLSETYRSVVAALGRSPLDRAAERARVVSSTDMGNVTRALPAIHPMIALDCGEAVNHQPEFARACASESADRAVLDGAIAMASTVVAAAVDPAQRARLLSGAEERAASDVRRPSNQFFASGGVA